MNSKIKSTAYIFQTFHLNRFKEFITIVINEGSHKRWKWSLKVSLAIIFCFE